MGEARFELGARKFSRATTDDQIIEELGKAKSSEELNKLYGWLEDSGVYDGILNSSKFKDALVERREKLLEAEKNAGGTKEELKPEEPVDGGGETKGGKVKEPKGPNGTPLSKIKLTDAQQKSLDEGRTTYYTDEQKEQLGIPIEAPAVVPRKKNEDLVKQIVDAGTELGRGEGRTEDPLWDESHLGDVEEYWGELPGGGYGIVKGRRPNKEGNQVGPARENAAGAATDEPLAPERQQLGELGIADLSQAQTMKDLTDKYDKIISGMSDVQYKDQELRAKLKAEMTNNAQRLLMTKDKDGKAVVDKDNFLEDPIRAIEAMTEKGDINALRWMRRYVWEEGKKRKTIAQPDMYRYFGLIQYGINAIKNGGEKLAPQ